MLRKFAVALLAASVFTAPVFAQGSGSTRSDGTPKVVTANPDLKGPKAKTSKRYAHHHAKHVRHVAHVKRVKHVKSAHLGGTKGTSRVRQQVSKSTTGANGANGAMTAPKTKTSVN